MKIKDRKSFEQIKKVELDGTTFSVRPFPFSQHRKIEVMSMLQEQFMYCLVDWANLTLEDGVEFPCNEENKLHLFDHYPEVRNFVIAQAVGSTVGLNEQLGN